MMPTFTWNINLGTLLELVAILGIFIKISKYFDKIDTIWKAMMGDGPTDKYNFFNRFLLVERQNAELWLLANKHVTLDRTRKEDK